MTVVAFQRPRPPPEERWLGGAAGARDPPDEGERTVGAGAGADGRTGAARTAGVAAREGLAGRGAGADRRGLAERVGGGADHTEDDRDGNDGDDCIRGLTELLYRTGPLMRDGGAAGAGRLVTGGRVVVAGAGMTCTGTVAAGAGSA